MKKFLLSVFLLTGTLASAQVELSKGLVAYYPFTGNAKDSGSNNLHGTVMGATLTQDRFGNNNAAYQFSGSANSYILVEDTALLAFNNKYSFSLWFYKDEPQAEATLNGLFFKGRDVENSTGFAISNATGKEYFYVRPDETYVPGNLNPTAATNKAWHHAVGILNNTSLELYIDGKLVDTKTVPSFTVTNNYPLVIGRHYRNADGSGAYEYPFKGKIDDIRFYNRVLNTAEIDALYKQTTVGINKDVAQKNNVKVYPNPVTNGKLTIQNQSENQIQSVLLYNIVGQQVYSKTGNIDKTIDVSALPAGVYTISITTPNGTSVSKIIIE